MNLGLLPDFAHNGGANVVLGENRKSFTLGKTQLFD
jgi:hypothetical protein